MPRRRSLFVGFIRFIFKLFLGALRLLWHLIRLPFQRRGSKHRDHRKRLVALTTSKDTPFVLSHWYHLVEDLHESPQQFYRSVEHAVRRRNLPHVEISRLSHFEGGMASARREYVRISRRDHSFEVSAALFGTGFFVSWWLRLRPGIFWRLMTRVPVVGVNLFMIIRPSTYYSLDAALVFQESIHSAVLEVLDATTNAQGLRSVSISGRRPILTQLFND